MRQYFHLLPVALTALALTGCVQDKPAPRLDSTDRNERIEAVHDAQNRYGVPAKPPESKPAKPPAPVIIPSTRLSNAPPANIDPALVGRWKGSWIRCEDYQFAADGTYTCDTLPYTFKGTWTVPSPGTLVCRYTLFGLPNSEGFTYRIKGDTLELNHGSCSTTYTKVR